MAAILLGDKEDDQNAPREGGGGGCRMCKLGRRDQASGMGERGEGEKACGLPEVSDESFRLRVADRKTHM